MKKKKTKKIELIAGIISVLLWVPGLLFVTGAIKPIVTSFNVADDGSVAVGVNYGIIICDKPLSAKRRSVPIFKPSNIELNDDCVTVFNDTIWKQYDRTTWKNTESGYVETDLGSSILQPVQMNGSEYSYSNKLGRARICEKKPSGTVVVWYEEPLFDYLMMLLLNVSIVPFVLALITLNIHMLNNYDYKEFVRHGKIIPR